MVGTLHIFRIVKFFLKRRGGVLVAIFSTVNVCVPQGLERGEARAIMIRICGFVSIIRIACIVIVILIGSIIICRLAVAVIAITRFFRQYIGAIVVAVRHVLRSIPGR